MADACAVEVHLTGLETPAGRAVARLFAEGDDLFRPARPEVAVPVEPLAFSGGFALGWFSGMPRFDKLAFEVTGPTVVDLVLR